jgi:putative endonuclease
MSFVFTKSKIKNKIKGTDNRKQFGKQGEIQSISYLKKQGFKILETNYRIRMAEIDIIARDKDTICFIEVKTRRNTRKGLPREAVTWTKQNKIIQAALTYIQKAGLAESKARFDVIEVQQINEKFSFNLIKNAFQAE